MAKARDRDEWFRLSVLRADLANINRDPKERSQPYQPKDFDIYDSQGRLKRPKKVVNPPLSKVIAAAFPQNKNKGAQ